MLKVIIEKKYKLLEENNMKKTLKVVLVFLGIMSIIIANNIAIAATGKVNDNNIRMRKEPNTTSEIITNLYKNDEVEVLEKTGDWYKIKYEKKVGYMRADLINITSGTVTDNTSNPTTQTQQTEKTENEKPDQTEVQTTEKKEYIVKEDTNIKTYPVIYARNKVVIKKGEKVEKIEELGKWIKVKKDNNTGWILINEVE